MTDRPKKLEVNGPAMTVAGVTIRLISVDRRAAFVEVSVDSVPRFATEKNSKKQVVLNSRQ